MKSLSRIALPFCLATALALPGIAAASAVQLQNDAFQEVVVTGKDGKPVAGKDGKPLRKRQKVTNAVPGSEIIYVLTYRNTGSKPLAGVVVKDDVPASLAFVPGSAQGAGTKAEVSVDGGKSYGVLEKLAVTNADGSSRPAEGRDVTHVRWSVQGAVAAGKDGSVTYRAVVR